MAFDSSGVDRELVDFILLVTERTVIEALLTQLELFLLLLIGMFVFAVNYARHHFPWTLFFYLVTSRVLAMTTNHHEI